MESMPQMLSITTENHFATQKLRHNFFVYFSKPKKVKRIFCGDQQHAADAVHRA